MKKLTLLLILFAAFGFSPCAALLIDEPIPYEISRYDIDIKLYDSATDGTNYVVLGSKGLVLVSTDLKNWKQAEIPFYNSGNDFATNRIVYNGKVFLITAPGALFVSADGMAWAEIREDDPQIGDYGTFERADGIRRFSIPLPDGKSIVTDDFIGYTYYADFFGRREAIYHSLVEQKEQQYDKDSITFQAKLADKPFRYTLSVTDKDYRSATQSLQIKVETIGSGGKTETATQTVPMLLSGVYSICDNGETVRIFYQTQIKDTAKGTKKTVIFELEAKDGIHFANTNTSYEIGTPQSLRFFTDGSIVALTRNEIYAASVTAAKLQKFSITGGNVAFGNKNEIQWTGKEWIKSGRFLSTDRINWRDANPSAQFLSVKNAYIWAGDSYLQYNAALPSPNFPIPIYGTMKQVSPDLKNELATITTPGRVGTAAFVNNTYYIGTYARNNTYTYQVFFSKDTRNWQRIDGINAMPFATQAGHLVASVTDTPRVENSLRYIASSKINLLFDESALTPVTYETVKPGLVDKVGDYIYTISTSGKGHSAVSAVNFSRDGVYFAGIQLPHQLGDIRIVYEFGDKIAVQSGELNDVITVLYDKKKLYAALDKALSKSNMLIQYNGTVLGFDAQPVTENGRILVPMRYLFEQMGAEVTWDAATRTAIAKKYNTEIRFSIDNPEATVGGTSKTMDVPARLVGGRTMVPLRFLSENLGYDVQWDAVHNMAVISQ